VRLAVRAAARARQRAAFAHHEHVAVDAVLEVALAGVPQRLVHRRPLLGRGGPEGLRGRLGGLRRLGARHQGPRAFADAPEAVGERVLEARTRVLAGQSGGAWLALGGRPDLPGLRLQQPDRAAAPEHLWACSCRGCHAITLSKTCYPLRLRVHALQSCIISFI